jgi:hypothetical protein
VTVRVLRRALVAALALLALAAAPAAAVGPGDGPGGPVLVVVDPGDQFGRYYAEILRAEGLNAFAVADTGALTAAGLAPYEVVVLARAAVSPEQAGALTNWVAGGGNLVAMRPDDDLAGLLGLGSRAGTLANAYLRVNTAAPPGAGITDQTMQFHDTADLWTTAGATSVATLFSDANSATQNPAVTLRSVGSAGGQAAAFTYDLARSVVYTRQGNPAAAGQELDNQAPVRSDDLFFPGWLDFSKVAIPQADEQQRLLANLVTEMNLDRTPLPRFWYLPRGLKAAFVMTGDDHASANGTETHFNKFKAMSAPGCSVADWGCIRGTSYIYSDTSDVTGLTPAQADAYKAEGFEIALHLTTNCANFTPESLAAFWNEQLPPFLAKWPGLGRPRTNRNHCIVWSDWASNPRVELANGVRLDTNYYYWPASWVLDRPGMFTGSGFPMRFADTNGALIDVYQAATEIPDESALTYRTHARALIDGALGPNGYYGVFTTNIHTDDDVTPAVQIIEEAQRSGVPVITAAQLLDWTDGRNDSQFTGLGYADGRLTFGVAPGAGARGLEAMIPAAAARGGLSSLTRDGEPVTPAGRTVKGIDYAVFPATAGAYVATYGPGAAPLTPEPARASGAGVVSRGATGGVQRARLLGRRRVRAARSGAVRLRLRCPTGESRCRISARIRKGRKALTGRRTVNVKPGATKTITLRLTRSARARLARARSMKVDVLITTRTGGTTSSTRRTRITLLAPRR